MAKIYKKEYLENKESLHVEKRTLLLSTGGVANDLDLSGVTIKNHIKRRFANRNGRVVAVTVIPDFKKI